MIAVGAVACAGSPRAGVEKKPKEPIELRPVLGEKSPVAPEAPVLAREPPGPTVVLAGGTLLLGNGSRIERGTIVLDGGRIADLGRAGEVRVPEGAPVVDTSGRFVTPGLIDTHSHMGVYAVPNVRATEDGNEMTDPTTPYVFSEHAFWPQDPALWHAVAGGVTTIQVLPGSGNIIGGRAVTLKLRPRLEARAMRFEGAPFGLKMACGENPKRVYGTRNQQPMSRMGSIARLRQAFIKAREYRYDRRSYEIEYADWKKKYDKAKANPVGAKEPGKEPQGPARDLGLETLAAVLEGEIKVHVHCYRADEMLLMLALAEELGFHISSFHHAVEAYKIAPELKAHDTAASVWSDWWGFKLEAYDAVEENAAILAANGARAIIHSDSSVGVQRLNQDAAKALHAGRRLGLGITEDDALRWITENPARALGVGDLTGTLERGKNADVVVWDKNPFSIYAQAERVYVDGELVFDRAAPPAPWSDFVVGSDVDEVSP